VCSHVDVCRGFAWLASAHAHAFDRHAQLHLVVGVEGRSLLEHRGGWFRGLRL
jgi:hypothetical protein